MNTDPADSPIRPAARSAQPPDEWGAALIVACLALGFVTSWAVYEMHTRVAQEIGTVNYRHDLDVLIGQQTDLGRMLADPRTKLVRLIPVADDSPLRLISVAWNQQTQTGAVFGDDLADAGERWYQLWLMPQTGQATIIRFGPARRGRAIYPFSSTRPAAPPAEMILTPALQTDQPQNPLARGKVARED
jgi:hypothetical protein